METTARVSRPVWALVVLLCAALIASMGIAERADSKRFSKKVVKSVSKKRLAGAYSGVTEQGTAVKFRLTRKGKIVDFVIPVTLSCETDVGDLDGDGTYTYYGGEIVQSIKSTTLRSAPLTGRKQTAQYPFGMTFEYESPFSPGRPASAGHPGPGVLDQGEVQGGALQRPRRQHLLADPETGGGDEGRGVHGHEERPPQHACARP